MIVLKWSGIVLGVVIVFVVIAAAYLGVFRSVVVSESEEGPFFFVYREMRGHDMAEVGRITTELNAVLESAGAAKRKPFDVFQPPDSQSPNEIGFVVEETDMPRVRQSNPSVLFKVIPRQRYMVATFPFKNQFSFVAGFIKVDPALRAHRSARNYRAALAIARNDGETITYLQPVLP